MDYTTQNKKIELITEDTIVIGVDIGSETNFARAFDWRGREISKKVFKFSNTIGGFNFFDGWMTDMLQRAAKMQIIVGCEPTGHYWFPLAGHLKDRVILTVTSNMPLSCRPSERQRHIAGDRQSLPRKTD